MNETTEPVGLGIDRAAFGPRFVFGAATSAYQIEGGHADGRGSSIWDSFAATPGNIADDSDGRVACDHYHLWQSDLDLVANAGFDAYRFSLAWPRIVPDGVGGVNEAGLDFYDRLVDGILKCGIKPYATLYHWDLPSALQDRGGWLNRDVASWFAEYADVVCRRLGDRLASIATLNEPWCIAYLGHIAGVHAPGLHDLRAGARAMHHVMLAHGVAVDALRAAGGSNLGIVLNLEKCEPASNSEADTRASLLWEGMFNRWYLDGIYSGAYPADIVERLAPFLPEKWEGDLATISRPLDWCGINYYTRALTRHDQAGGLLPYTKTEGPLEKTDIGWEIYPSGLHDLLKQVATYTDLPIYVTENGMAERSGTDDHRRVRFHSEHLKAVLSARHDGVNVGGYFAWSLLDNFEWAEGYTKRFGLVEVDFSTQERTPRKSYEAFQAMLRRPQAGPLAVHSGRS